MARHAGFHHIHITEPASDAFHSHNPIHLTLKASTLGSFKLAAINIARQQAFVRRLHTWWRYLMGPQVSSRIPQLMSRSPISRPVRSSSPRGWS